MSERMERSRSGRLTRRRYLSLGAVSALASLSGCPRGDTDPPSRTPTTVQDSPIGTSPPTDTPHPTDTSPRTGTTEDEQPDGPRTYYVAPAGNDEQPGTRVEPLGSIRAGIKAAMPGETIHLLPGEYQEAVFTIRSGEPGAPITITGPPEAVIRQPPGKPPSTVTIKHSHIHLRGPTVTGLIDPAAPGDADSYAVGPLLTCQPMAEDTAYLRDIVLKPSRLGNGQSTLVRLMRCACVEIGDFEVIGPAGTALSLGDKVDHVAEVLYIGTGFDLMSEPWYPWDTPDRTHHVHVHHIDNSAGHQHGDFLEFKAGTYACLAEYCTDRNAGFATDGSHGPSMVHGGRQNTIRYCDIADSPTGVVFDGNEAYASRGNNLYGTRITGTENYAIAFTTAAGPERQGSICGNAIDGEVGFYNVPDEPAVAPEAACARDIPPGDGIGHTGGDSPWA